MTKPLISVKDLTLRFKTDEGLITAVEDVSFDIAPGEVLGLVGESGSGKSVTAKSLMLLNPDNAVYDPKSSITFNVDDKQLDVFSLTSPKDRMIIRGGAISMIFQEPMASFAPAISVGDQMVEQLLIHSDMNKARAKEISIEMLTRVGIPDPDQRFGQYAFEFSGGMRQRAMIAMAISNDPQLLIADEPTTALDVTVQAQVMEVLHDVQAATGSAMMLITHDLGLVAGSADRVQVMYASRLMESGTIDDIFYESRNPYTRALLDSIPDLETNQERLVPIPGNPPSLLNPSAGCAFRPRCSMAAEECAQAVPEMVVIDEQHSSRCLRVADIEVEVGVMS
jgi:peptide/nickel transport system ATP-binding protein